MAIPRDPALDSLPALLREGYAFISNRCTQLESDAFQTRIALRSTVCMQGEEAARLFYEAPLTRRGAVPHPIFALLQDVAGASRR
jgi:fatty-acid peroxygenase